MSPLEAMARAYWECINYGASFDDLPDYLQVEAIAATRAALSNSSPG